MRGEAEEEDGRFWYLGAEKAEHHVHKWQV